MHRSETAGETPAVPGRHCGWHSTCAWRATPPRSLHPIISSACIMAMIASEFLNQKARTGLEEQTHDSFCRVCVARDTALHRNLAVWPGGLHVQLQRSGVQLGWQADRLCRAGLQLRPERFSPPVGTAIDECGWHESEDVADGDD